MYALQASVKFSTTWSTAFSCGTENTSALKAPNAKREVRKVLNFKHNRRKEERSHCLALQRDEFNFNQTDKDPEIPQKFEDIIRDAQRSTLALSHFRKKLRVEVPFPVSRNQTSLEKKQAILKLAEDFVEGFINHYGKENVFVPFMNLPQSAELNVSPELSVSSELLKLRIVRPKIFLMVFPTDDEALFYHQLIEACGEHTPVVVFNPMWEHSEGSIFRSPSQKLLAQITSKFDQESAVAFHLEEFNVPRSFLEGVISQQGARIAVHKKYGSKWSIFVRKEDDDHQNASYHFVRSQGKRPTMKQISEIARSYPSQAVLPINRLMQFAPWMPGKSPSCPIGQRYDKKTGTCVPM